MGAQHTARAPAPARWSRQFPQCNEYRRVGSSERNIGDDQRPFAGFQLAKKQLGVTEVAYAPTLRIQNLAQGALVLVVLVENEDADLAGSNWGRRRHLRSIAA